MDTMNQSKVNMSKPTHSVEMEKRICEIKTPAFQFYPTDFLADENVVLMSNAELGCYIRLICHCWREGSIPSEVAKIARMCGENVQDMTELWPAIMKCFTSSLEETGRLIHPRLQKERLKQLEHRIERAEAGKKGAEARWGNGSATPPPLADNGSASSSASSPASSPEYLPARLTEAGIDEKFPMHAAWKPSAHLHGLALQANVEVVGAPLSEFISYWLTQTVTLRTQAEWDKALLQSSMYQAEQSSLKKRGPSKKKLSNSASNNFGTEISNL